MSNILYYSNYCDKCKNILRTIGNSEIKKDIHFVCIDKRFRDPQTGAIYVILENQQKIVLPPQVQKVPAMLLLNEGNKVIFGAEVTNKIKEQVISLPMHTELSKKQIKFISNTIIGFFE